jgi:hypothetical protein
VNDKNRLGTEATIKNSISYIIIIFNLPVDLLEARFIPACNTTSLVEVKTSNKQRRIPADKRSNFERGDCLYCRSCRKNNCSFEQCRVGEPFSATGERKYGTLNFGFLVISNTCAIIQCVWLHLRKIILTLEGIFRKCLQASLLQDVKLVKMSGTGINHE